MVPYSSWQRLEGGGRDVYEVDFVSEAMLTFAMTDPRSGKLWLRQAGTTPRA